MPDDAQKGRERRGARCLATMSSWEIIHGLRAGPVDEALRNQAADDIERLMSALENLLIDRTEEQFWQHAREVLGHD